MQLKNDFHCIILLFFIDRAKGFDDTTNNATSTTKLTLYTTNQNIVFHPIVSSDAIRVKMNNEEEPTVIYHPPTSN